MDTTSLIQAVGSTALFPSRIFMPAFLTALLLRFGHRIPLIAGSGVLAHVHGHPTWFTSDVSLIVLGILSAVELFGQKSPEVRHLLHEFDAILKAAAAALTSLGVMSTTDAGFIHQNIHEAGLLQGLIPLFAAAVTYRLSLVRRNILQPIQEQLAGTHLDHLFSWAEDLWVLIGAILLIVVPILVLCIVIAGTGAMLIVRRHLAVVEERTKGPCSRCGASIYLCATACPSCRMPTEHPRAVGFLGHTKPYPAPGVVDHPYRLVEKGRCPVCATRLKARTLHQTCISCRQTVPADPAFAEAYMGYISRRVPMTLGIAFLLGLVPIVGLIAGAIYYQAVLVAPFTRYLPFGRGVLLRWGLRLFFLLMVLLQWVPLLGAFALPMMALVTYYVYSSSYRTLAMSDNRPGAGQRETGAWPLPAS